MLRRSNPRHRLNAALIVIAVVLSLFAGRLIQMQGLQWSKYRTLAAQRWTSTINIPTLRGSITTSDGLTLAMTEQTSQIVANPKEMSTAQKGQVASALAGPLGLPAAHILSLLEHPSSPENEVLEQTASQATSQRVMKLGLPGIALGGFPTYARLYPNGSLASNLVGFTNESASTGDLTGEAGLEQEFNSVLSGRDGSEEVETGVNGMPIAGTETDLRQPVPARNLRLTIQSSIQYDAEQACKQRVRQTKAKNCSIVVMQPGTGHILAMAQYPTFNPNRPVTNLDATHNIAVYNTFAPGSTLKPLTVAAALEKGGQTPMSTYTVPDQIVVHGFTFHDAEPHPTARYTIAGILANSLNDGMVQLVQKVTPLQQYDYLRSFGLDKLSGLGLPGESPGLLARPGSKDYWNDEPYELSFGQGIGVTAIQMASDLRHHRQRRRPGPAVHRGRDDQRRGQVHARAQAGLPPGHPGHDGQGADDHDGPGPEGRRPPGRALGHPVRLPGGGQDRHRAGVGHRAVQAPHPVPVRIQLHRHRACSGP